MKIQFLKFWLLNIIVFISCVVAANMGVLKAVYEKDSSFLTFVIIGIYVFCASYLGNVAWDYEKDKKLPIDKIDLGWFFSELCLSLGMIGTVVGFIQMLGGFSELPEGSAGLQKMLGQMSYGMSTALYTTLAGLIFGNLLKLQCFWLDKYVKQEDKCQDTDSTAPKQVS